MKNTIAFGASAVGLCLFAAVFYTACPNGTDPGSGFGTCTRPARYTSMDEIEARAILTFEDWVEQNNITLYPDEEDVIYGSSPGDLAGTRFTSMLTRPVKYPNGVVEMPPGWLEPLEPNHPWHTPPDTADETFPAYFEVRIVDPLLYDPESWEHYGWATSYLEIVGTQSVITSIVGTDTTCN